MKYPAVPTLSAQLAQQLATQKMAMSGPLPKLWTPTGVSPMRLTAEPPQPLEKSLVAEPVEGWRMWQLQKPSALMLDERALALLAERYDRGDNPFRGLLGHRLTALGVPYTWEAGMVTAICSASKMVRYSPGGASHEAPHAKCMCGFWAFKTREMLERGSVLAYGRVQLWGRIIEHANGYRAQYAKPLEVFLPGGTEDVAAELAAFYGVPVRAEPTPTPTNPIGQLPPPSNANGTGCGNPSCAICGPMPPPSLARAS